MDDLELQRIEQIYDALDADDPAQALLLAQNALSDTGGDDPVLRLLSGLALLELDRAPEAVETLDAAMRSDPEDPDIRSNLALALFHCCRFDEATEQVAEALKRDPDSPDAHHVSARLAERKGDLVRADEHFLRASQLDPEGFPPPFRVGADAFDARLQQAIAELPERFRTHLSAVAVIVEDLPADELLHAESPSLDPGLLGLFDGVPLGHDNEGQLPARIYLFRRNLERYAGDERELAEQIRVTLCHELGHYLGLDEEELGDSGYA